MDLVIKWIPVIAPVLATIISSLFSAFQQHKKQNSGILSEQYKCFVAPIYHLLTSNYSANYIITKIEYVFEEYPYLVPDQFDSDFFQFKQNYEENPSIKNTDFYEYVNKLYIYLRHELHYSKRKLSRKQKRKTQQYFGKFPTLFGVLLRSLCMSFIAFLVVLPLYFFYNIGSIEYPLYATLLIVLSIVMIILTVFVMNKYYDL